jgi:AcrR family transcriptional regulator
MTTVAVRTGARAAKRHQTEERILASARRLFSERGFQGTTIRSVAADAVVDPALVMHYFGSKEDLFTRALSVTVEEPCSDDADEALEILLRSLDTKLRGLPETTLIMMRSMLTHPDAGEVARSLLDKQIDRVGNAITGSDSRLRAALVMSSILGLTIGRELLGIRDLQQATSEQIIDLLRPSLRILLNEDA